MKTWLPFVVLLVVACDAKDEPEAPAAKSEVADPEAPAEPEEPELSEAQRAEQAAAAARTKADESLEVLRRYVASLPDCPVGPTPVLDEADMLLIQSTEEGREALRVEMEKVIEARRDCPPSAGPAAP